jgi:hypothetical protein
MTQSHVISGLVAKRSELAGTIKHHQEIMRRLSAAIVNIDGTIKLFDPDYDLRSIKAKVPKQANPWFKHGETTRMVLDVLRTASQPLSTRQIGEAMMDAKGMAVDDVREWDAVLKLVLSAVQRAQKKGIVTRVGRVGGDAMLWQMT